MSSIIINGHKFYLEIVAVVSYFITVYRIHYEKNDGFITKLYSYSTIALSSSKSNNVFFTKLRTLALLCF